MSPCTAERRDVSIQHRLFTVDCQDIETLALALSLSEGEQLIMGDLRPREQFKTFDGRIVQRTR